MKFFNPFAGSRCVSRPFLPRLFKWLLVTFLLLLFIIACYPQQFPVAVYKLTLVTLAGVVGYWLDRDLFPYARPGNLMEIVEPSEPLPVLEPANQSKPVDGQQFATAWLETPTTGAAIVFAGAMLRRALIVGCAMLAMGLGA